ncbi:hypothetical protein EUZ85_00430 [Hahella sp. KA22]|uniref:hypothetical protein n=1 Tax=Hahella sp. KA22 TaxID=1628392 RepID=UPI000FDE4A21|nr:hypothetical protein [Hahella sp. KA22]AZZ94964.1 hypothetical protein ENC22_28720 [Hahella sp. KA22]QAY52609.1 hypothetical protein EUZ85_00430 [Hahella sp. KA22]
MNPHASALPVHEPATPALAALLRRRQIVGIGDAHGVAAILQWLIDSLRRPDIAPCLDTIVVEFAAARSQPLLDAYIAGEPGLEHKIDAVCSDTLHFCAWFAEVYRRFFQAVRQINQRLPTPRVRVLAADPPIDWRAADAGRQWREAHQRREAHYQALIEREVIARNRRALLIFGAFHLLRNCPAGSTPEMDAASEINNPPGINGPPLASRLHNLGPEQSFYLWPHFGHRPDVMAVAQGEGWQAPTLVHTARSALGALPFAALSQRTPYLSERPVRELFDGYLFLGAVDKQRTVPRHGDSPIWLAERRRRAQLLPPPHRQRFLAAIDAIQNVHDAE